jgi:cysteinyl-tRNA synthetase
MSKSLGNIFYIKDYLKKYSGEVLRLALLSGHYRQSLNWTDESIEQAQSMLNRLYRILKKVDYVEIKDDCVSDSVINCLCDDLNTPEALAAINKLANKLSKETDISKLTILKSKLLWSVNMLGILQESPDKWLGIGQTDESIDSNEIELLLNARKAARDSKAFSKADEIRDKLNNMGIEIEDTPDGTIWRTK